MVLEKIFEMAFQPNTSGIRLSNATVYSGALLSLTSIISITVIIAVSIRQRMKKKILKTVFRGILLIEISFFCLVFFPLILYMTFLFTDQKMTFTLANLSFSLFLVFWLLGAVHYFRHSARIPKRRKKTFKVIYSLMIALAVSFLALVIYPNDTLRTLLILAGFVAVIMFYFVVRNEIEKNSSKLAKAKLSLFEYSIIMVIIPTLLSFLRPYYLAKQAYDLAIIALLPFIIFAVPGSLFAYWSLNVPEWIRNKYQIPTQRYLAIAALNMM